MLAEVSITCLLPKVCQCCQAPMERARGRERVRAVEARTIRHHTEGRSRCQLEALRSLRDVYYIRSG
jgi:hypothetical protein